jgi:endo-1,4-beta-xylanase
MVAFSSIVLGLSAIAGSAFAAPTADVPDFALSPVEGKSLAARQDYNQNYKTSGNVQFNPTNNGYSVTFSNAGDFVVGKGWKKGTTRKINFQGSTQPSAGTVLVSVYGWTTGPLIEYYIQEYTSNGSGSAQGTKMGQVTCDGSVYDIWKHTQVNQPSIQGTTTFTQYISNRVNKRPGSGTVTTKCHFDAWAKLGMNLGQHNYQTLATEGWGNAAGKSQYTITGS